MKYYLIIDSEVCGIYSSYEAAKCSRNFIKLNEERDEIEILEVSAVHTLQTVKIDWVKKS